MQQRQALGVLQIERDRALTSVEAGEHTGDTVVHRAESPHEITATGTLDLDDVRALLRKDHRRERTRGSRSEVDDADIAQREGHPPTPSITPSAASSARRSGERPTLRRGRSAGRCHRGRTGEFDVVDRIESRRGPWTMGVDRDLVDRQDRGDTGVVGGEAVDPVVAVAGEKARPEFRGNRRLPAVVFVRVDEMRQVNRFA